MNIDGQLATYTWLDNQNIRLKYAGVLGTVNEWIGVDPILEVKIDHNPPEDTLVITNINGRIEQYHRAANSRYSRKEHKNDIKQPLN